MTSSIILPTTLARLANLAKCGGTSILGELVSVALFSVALLLASGVLDLLAGRG